MANLKMSDLTDGSTANSDDRIPAARSPYGSTTSRYITPAYINSYILPLNNTVSGDWTFSSSFLSQLTGNAFDASATLGHGGGDGTLHVHTATAGAVTAGTDFDDLTVENSGNAGVSVLSGTTGTGVIAFGDSGDNDIGKVAYDHNTNFLSLTANAAAQVTIDGPQNFVGLGTTAPDGKLHLYWDDCTATAVAGGDDFIIENGTAAGMTIMTHNDQIASIYFGDEDDADVGKVAYSHINNTMGFTANTNTVMVYDGTGLMIGQNAVPAALLHSKSGASGGTANGSSDEIVAEGSADSGISILSGATSNGTLAFGDGSAAVDGKVLYNHNTRRMVFSTASQEKLLINENGFLHADPAGTFALGGNSYHTFRNANNLAGSICQVLINGGGATDSTASFLISASTGAADRFYVYGNGNVVNTNNSYGAISDRKLKKDIKDANSQWDDIKKMKLRNFEFTDSPGKKQLGCVAQELKAVSPGLVFNTVRPGHGDMVEAVNYSVLYMKGLGALQEAMARIEDLEKEVGKLK